MVAGKKFQIFFIIFTVIFLCSCSVKEHHARSEIILINDSADEASSETASFSPSETTVETAALGETINTTPAVSSVHNKVYYTKTGKHYHYLDKCGSGTYYECTLDEAKQNGLTPCKKCVK